MEGETHAGVGEDRVELGAGEDGLGAVAAVADEDEGVHELLPEGEAEAREELGGVVGVEGAAVGCGQWSRHGPSLRAGARPVAVPAPTVDGEALGRDLRAAWSPLRVKGSVDPVRERTPP